MERLQCSSTALARSEPALLALQCSSRLLRCPVVRNVYNEHLSAPAGVSQDSKRRAMSAVMNHEGLCRHVWACQCQHWLGVLESLMNTSNGCSSHRCVLTLSDHLLPRTLLARDSVCLHDLEAWYEQSRTAQCRCVRTSCIRSPHHLWVSDGVCMHVPTHKPGRGAHVRMCTLKNICRLLGTLRWCAQLCCSWSCACRMARNAKQRRCWLRMDARK